MKANLDAIDRKILRYLINNARMPYLEIARECGISGAAIHQRIHNNAAANVEVECAMGKVCISFAENQV